MNISLYDEEMLDEYVDLVIRMGVNIQPEQQLIINSSVDCAFFARLAMQAAFKAGASNVHLRWNDDICDRTRYLMANDSVFDTYPQWDKLMVDTLIAEGTAFLSISSSDPEKLKGVDSKRLSRYNIAASAALKNYYEHIMSGGVRWCVASVPSAAWARKVFPDAANADDAIRLLWNNIFAAARIGGGNAISRWKAHIGNLKKRAELLSEHRFQFLHFRNSIGTDLRIGLPDNHVWIGGADFAKDGKSFIANIPTEEVFTAPDAGSAEGTVVGTMPNVYRGNLIDGFSITFKDGKVIFYDADTGREHLKNMISDIAGMDRLGEIALVEYDSPISNTGILFYNTLYDENASCHLALGSAYPDCIKGGANMSSDERRAKGLNVSDDHHDFMFGSKDMSITGIKANGDEVEVFKNGCFVI